LVTFCLRSAAFPKVFGSVERSILRIEFRHGAGRVTRVPAIQLEKLVVETIRAKAQPDTESKGDLSDRAVIDRYVTRVIVRLGSIDIELRNQLKPPNRCRPMLL
jgi:hypothetical protein